MGKYSRLSGQRPPPPPPWRIHPVWRGIGCLLFLIGPVLAYLTADLLVTMTMQEGWYPVPGELARAFTLPLLNITIPHFFANLMVTALLLLFGFAMIMVIYTLVYAVAGPSRYSPLDSPPVRDRPKPKR